MARNREQPIALLITRGDQLQVMFPDDAAVSDAVRRAVRSTLRPKPSKATYYRTWTLNPIAFETLVRTLKANGYRVESYKQGETAPAKEVPPSSDHAILGVTAAAPWPVVEAAYRALAKLYHPDVAGASAANVERMKQINAAYERLEARVRGR